MASYLVTGASRGIGLELVRQLAAAALGNGHIFAVTRSAASSGLEKIISENDGRVVNVIIPDLTSDADVSKAVEKVESTLGHGRGLDVLINNAGVMPFESTVGELPTEQLAKVFSDNVLTAHGITKGFLPLLKMGGQKKIISISTTLGSLALAEQYSWAPAYSYKITKAAMNMWSKQLAMNLEKEGFCVLLISPGWLKTDLGSQNADLDVDVGVKAVLDIVHKAGPEKNGKFETIYIEGWKTDGPNTYLGGETPW